MKQLTVNDAIKLVRNKTSPAISIYLGTNIQEPSGSLLMEDNLKNLYHTAESLVMRAYDAPTRNRLLHPLKKALAAMKLTKSKGGIGIYHSENFTGMVKLPTPVTDLVVASESFHLKPVLRCIQLRRSYYMLVFRKKYADLILITADAINRIERVELRMAAEPPVGDEEAPKRWMRDRMKFRYQRDLQQCMHNLNRHFEGFWNDDPLPILLAGPKRMQEAFRSSCSHAQLVEQGLAVPCEDSDVQTLVNEGADMMEKYFAEMDARSIIAFRVAEASGLASTSLEDIALAVSRGQVASLLIAEDRHLWGNLDRETGHVQVLKSRRDAASDDLLDDIAELTLLKGGKVTVLPSFQMPNRHLIAAIFRWVDTPPLISGDQALQVVERSIEFKPAFVVNA